MAIAMALVGIGQIFLDFGMGAALIQRKNLRKLHATSAFYFNVACGGLLTLIVFSLAGAVGWIFESSELVGFVKALSVIFLIHSLNVVQLSTLRRALDYRLIARIDVIAAVLGGVVGVSAALLGAGAWALVAQMVTISFSTTVVTWLASSWRPAGRPSIFALRQLWAYGSRIYYSNLLDVAFTRLDILIIGKFYSPVGLGHYERAKATSQVLVQNSSVTLMNVLFPVFSQIQNDLGRTRIAVLTGLKVLGFITFMLIGGLFLVASDLVLLLYGENWTYAASIFKILVISGFGYPLSAFLLNVLAGRGRSDEFLRLEIIKKALLACNLLILIFWGIDFFLYGLIVQSAFAVMIAAISVAREVGLNVQVITRPLVTQCLIAVGGVMLVTSIRLPQALSADRVTSVALTAIFFAALYFGVSLVFRTDAYKAMLQQCRPRGDGIRARSKKTE